MRYLLVPNIFVAIVKVSSLSYTMFYYYFRFFIWLSNIFGLKKPLVKPPGKVVRLNKWQKIWPVIIIVSVILNYSLTMKRFRFDIKKHLDKICNLNDFIVHVAIILIEFLNNDDICVKLYETMNTCFLRFNVNDRNLKMIATKLYFWLFISTTLFTVAIIFEMVDGEPPFIILMKIPMFITIFHLTVHLYLILSLLKIINYSLSKMFLFNDKPKIDQGLPSKKSILGYLINFKKCFIDDDHLQQRYDIKTLCKAYDDINTCLKLLEKCHGLQVRA